MIVFRSVLERLGTSGGRLGDVLERPGSILGRLGAVFVALKGVLDVKMRFETSKTENVEKTTVFARFLLHQDAL